MYRPAPVCVKSSLVRIADLCNKYPTSQWPDPTMQVRFWLIIKPNINWALGFVLWTFQGPRLLPSSRSTRPHSLCIQLAHEGRENRWRTMKEDLRIRSAGIACPSSAPPWPDKGAREVKLAKKREFGKHEPCPPYCFHQIGPPVHQVQTRFTQSWGLPILPPGALSYVTKAHRSDSN